MNTAVFVASVLNNSGRVTSSQTQRAKLRALKNAVAALRELEKFGGLSITLTEDQLRKIDEARANGEDVKITVGL